MKKLFSMLLTAALLFSVVGPLVVDAKGMSGGSRGGGGSSSSFKSSGSSSTSKPNLSKPDTNKSTTNKSSTTNTSKPEVKKPSFYKSSGKSVKSSQLDSSKYKSGYQTSPNGSSFTNTLLTTMGVYLILDSFDSDGDPVYIDSDTGKIIDEDELEQMEFNDIEDEDESSNALMVIFTVIMMMAIFGFAMFMIFRW